MRFREAATRVAHRARWRLLPAAIFFPSPLLIAVFRNSSLEGWTLLSAITFALLLTIWMGIIAWLISPIGNWRSFKVVLMALSCLILGWLTLGSTDPPLPTALVLGSAAVLLLVAAARIGAPSAEDIRLARIADEETSGHVSWWITLLALAVFAVPVIFLLASLYRML